MRKKDLFVVKILLSVFVFCFVIWDGLAQSGDSVNLPEFRVEKYENGSIRFVLNEVNEILHTSSDSIQAFKEHAISFAKNMKYWFGEIFFRQGRNISEM